MQARDFGGQVQARLAVRRTCLGCAQSCTQIFLKCFYDPRRKVRELRVREGGLLALELHADHQRKFPCGYLAAAKQIGRLDGAKFGNLQRSNRSLNCRKRNAIVQYKRKISFYRWKSRQGREPQAALS